MNSSSPRTKTFFFYRDRGWFNISVLGVNTNTNKIISFKLVSIFFHF